MVRDAARDLLGLVAGGGALVLDARLLDAGGAGAGDGGDVAVVGVDADEGLAVVGLDVLDHDVALAHGLAVAAGAVQLAKVDDGEAVDGHGAQAVVLDDLVVGSGGAAVGKVSRMVYIRDGDLERKTYPPLMLALPLPLRESASSHTADHHTFSMVQLPSQCTPSIWSLPMMAFLSVAPSLRMKTASLSSPSS